MMILCTSQKIINVHARVETSSREDDFKILKLASRNKLYPLMANIIIPFFCKK